MYLNSITILRAIAIVLIVASHCDIFSDIKQTNFIHRLLINITAGGTIVFVFISGFLYHHIFYLKSKTHLFFKKRVKRLIIPYFILSIIPIIYKLNNQPNYWTTFIPSEKTGIFYEYLYPTLLFLLSGEHLVAYWYIPFAILLFLCYPLHSVFIKANHKSQIIIMVVTFIISLLVQRPKMISLIFIQSLVYFTPAYLFGIYCSINKVKIYFFFKNKEYLFLTPFLLILIIQTYFEIVGNNSKSFFSYEGIDTILPQKIFLCLFLMIWLHRFEENKNKFVMLLANTSFAIYFLHGYVLRLLYIIKEQLGINEFSKPILSFLISLFLLISISILVAIIFKKIFKNKSYYFTGY
ncbi:acyltransferase [Maribacter sp.]|uniref:acyltransferase family protein n=1 Tax=Maribacter sp. TaxID=1897614 RepID=UPI00329903DB